MTKTVLKTNLQQGGKHPTKGSASTTPAGEKPAPSMQYQQGFAAGR